MSSIKCFCCKKRISAATEDIIVFEGTCIPKSGPQKGAHLYICGKCFKERTVVSSDLPQNWEV